MNFITGVAFRQGPVDEDHVWNRSISRFQSLARVMKGLDEQERIFGSRLPWSPLKGGRLSGKYTCVNGAKMQGLRGTFGGDFTEKQYDIIDVVGKVAEECQASASAVALAWLKARPGVSSTILGVSTLAQLEANLQALDVVLTPEQIERLDGVSKPVLNFPADFLTHSPSISHAGATVNGVPSQRIFLVPEDDSSRW